MLITILTIICALVLIFVFMTLPGESSIEQRAPFWGANCAHRGLHSRDGQIPENSLAAFTGAVEKGYAIEMDLRLTKDKQVVVFHDDDLMRMCSKEGRVDSFTFSELRELRLNGTIHFIPLLSEVLKTVSMDVPLILELKPCPNYKELCEAAWAILRLYDGDICIESFDPRIVRWFKKNAPGLLRGQLSALPSTLGRTPQAFAVGLGLCNFIGRPHFVAYQICKKPLSIRFADLFAMRISWTCRSEQSAFDAEQHSDAVIFEHYEPEPYYKELPGKPSMQYSERFSNIDTDAAPDDGAENN